MLVFIKYSKENNHSYFNAYNDITTIVSSLAYINLFGRRGIITHGILKLTLNTYGWRGIVIMETLGLVSMSSLLLISIIGE